MARKRKEYALYHGDVFITIGTLEEIAEQQKVNKSTIAFYGTPANEKRKKNGFVLVKLDD